MKKIPLTKGKFTIIDKEDFERVNRWKWQITTGYATKSASEVNPYRAMHRLILNCSINQEVDHINGNRLDNRKINLRLATRRQNCMNRPKQKNNTSGYKGVFWQPQLNRWWARIKIDGEYLSLKTYKTKEEAAVAYDKAAFKNYGEFAHLNFPMAWEEVGNG